MEDKTDLMKIFRIMKNNLLFLFLAFLIPVLITMVISLIVPKSYTASEKILAPEVASGGSISSNPFGLLSSLGIKGKGFSTQSMIAIMKSDYMMSDIVDSFNIKEMYRIKEKRDAMEYLKKKLISISVNNVDGTISISITTRSPETSYNIARFFIYNLDNINRKLNLTTQQPISVIINPPYIPINKSGPKIKLNMAIAGFLGLLFGFTFLYIKAKFRNDI